MTQNLHTENSTEKKLFTLKEFMRVHSTANLLTNSEDCKKFWGAMVDFMNREPNYQGLKISEYHLFRNHNYHKFGRLGRTSPASICLAKQW
jgi:L-rhamnose mutarotase